MQDIIFRKLRLENFRKYYESDIDFPNGLTAIIGPNGAGKSTYFMAIVAVLYGRTAEGIELPDLVNKKVKKNLLIELTMTIDGNLHMFRRAYKHKLYNDKLFIYKNWDEDSQTGTDITEKTNRETYNKISSMLVPREVFLNTIYFSQQVKDFFTALTDSKQKDIFDAILQLQEWGGYKTAATIKEKDMADEILRFEGESSHILSVIPEKEAIIQTIKDNMVVQQQRLDDDKARAEENVKIVEMQLVEVNKAVDDNGFTDEEMHEKQKQYVNANNALAKIDSDLETDIQKLKTAAKADERNLESLSEKTKLEKQAEYKDIFAKFKDEHSKKEGTVLSERSEALKDYDKKLSDLEFAKSKKVSEIDQAQIAAGSELNEFKAKLNIDAIKAKIESELAKFDGRKNLLKTQADTIKDKVKAEKDTQERLQKEIVELEESLNQEVIICKACGQEITDKKHIQKIQDKIKDLKADVDKSVKVEENQRNLFEKIKEDFSKVQADSKNIAEQGNKKIVSVETQIDVKAAEVEKKIKELSDDLVKFTSESERQKLAINEDRSDIEEEFRVKLSELEEVLLNKQEEFKKEYSDFAITESKLLADRIADVKLKLDEYIKIAKDDAEVKRSEAKDVLAAIDEELLKLRTKKLKHNELVNNKTTLDERLSSIHDILDRLKEAVIDDSSLKLAEEDFKKAKEKSVEIEKELNIKRKHLKILEFWKEGFSDRGIPSMLIDSSVPFMNKTIREELEKIVPGRFMVSFDTLSETKSGDIREKFSVKILNLNTGADRHDLLSGGEKRIIDVCCLRVLRLLSENLYQKRFNVTFFDEVLDSIDNENSRTFCAALRKVASDQNMSLISHAVDKIGEVDRVLRM